MGRMYYLTVWSRLYQDRLSFDKSSPLTSLTAMSALAEVSKNITSAPHCFARASPSVLNVTISINITITQGGRTWQPFVGGKNGHENFRQVRIYNFRHKCVVFARNRKFANLTQWNMQYIPCDSALLVQETLFFTQKDTFFAQRSPKSA